MLPLHHRCAPVFSGDTELTVTSASVEESNLSSVRFRPDLGCRSLNRMILPYSELLIGTPHLELNQLLRCGFHCEEFHSSLRFSGHPGRQYLFNYVSQRRLLRTCGLRARHLLFQVFALCHRSVSVENDSYLRFPFSVTPSCITDKTLLRPSRHLSLRPPSRVGSLEIPSLLRQPNCFIYLPQGELASSLKLSRRARYTLS